MTAGRKIITSSQDWCTPKKYVDAVRLFFHGKIGLDPCSNRQSIVHAATEYLPPRTDGLEETWDYKTIYINPPYGIDKERGTSIRDWLRRCCDARLAHGSEVLALVPVATNTGHWKKYVFGRANSVCFLADTRLKFVIEGNGDTKGAPMACAIVYWGVDNERFYDIFSKFGAVVDVTNLIAKKWKSPDMDRGRRGERSR
jgi:hypothetical protein